MLSNICTVENDQLLYRLALTRLPGIGPVQTKKLIRYFGNAGDIFCASRSSLLAAGLSARAAESIRIFDDHDKLAGELALLQQNSIRLLFFTDAEYPRRLLAIEDAPPLLYFQGKVDLNAQKIVSIIGTRSSDDYGRHITEQLIKELASSGVVVISGLAAGIDTAAHKAALNNALPTVAVLGQGLGTAIYPYENAGLSQQMLKQGGLLTSFEFHEAAAPYNFPARNQLVAGLCDALLVVQTKLEGGSMLTVGYAKKYKKTIFAVPGRPTDKKSQGCNWLIRQREAHLLASGEQLAATMGWAWPQGGTGVQALLSFEPPADRQEHENGDKEERLLQLIDDKDSPGIDELATCSGLDASTVALLLLRLELRGSVIALPGKRFMLAPGEPPSAPPLPSLSAVS
ncbi:MAG TPA: DNA-processing protein DprA [Puia sp.]|nr:DNA-processing protein DprA [Puia sp.]